MDIKMSNSQESIQQAISRAVATAVAIAVMIGGGSKILEPVSYTHLTLPTIYSV